MASMTRIGFFLLTVSFATATSVMTTELLLEAVRSNARGGLRSTRALNALDINKDGRVEPSEVEAFARSEGLESASATDDFTAIDSNGDGVLDSSELLQVVGVGETPANTETPTKPPLARAVKPAVVANLAASKATKQDAHISIQEPHVPPPASQDRQKSIIVEPEETSPSQVKPTPVQRMVKHFAQVLRTAEVVPYVPQTAPLQAHTAKLPQSVKPSVEMKLHVADVSSAAGKRGKVQSVAKEVADQLALAEAAQTKARVFDRKAAEERANATVLAKSTAQEALNAGADAAHKKANELLANIAKLEDQAERAQVRSAALHSKAKLETQEASELMAVADRALNHKRH